MGSLSPTRGRWLALVAALLGWLFDGFEMGLFPVIARPALLELTGGSVSPDRLESTVAVWNSLALAGFLFGAATGGVLFGWLGDRLGRVRAMSLSILTYALCSGLGAFTTHPLQIVLVRYVAALGMGGEWSLGVALVMELWGGRSRALLAGTIGAAGNLGYVLVAALSMGLQHSGSHIADALNSLGLPDSWVQRLTANSAWRLLMVAGTLPALLTFVIRLFVPESQRWQNEQRQGRTSSWAVRDLLGVVAGAAGCGLLLVLWHPVWSAQVPIVLRLAGTLIVLAGITAAFLHPIRRYLNRSGASPQTTRSTFRLLIVGACISGVALLGTWGSIQWATFWVDELTGKTVPLAKQWTQFCSAWGAVLSCIIGALMCDWMGRRLAYRLLCVLALGSTLLFYLGNSSYGPMFLFTVFLAGGCTAAFYGWLPLYLPELFPTAVRATGQGFSFNFGRILAAIGALQTGVLKDIFKDHGGYPTACSLMSLIYLVGLVVIGFAPETKGRELPE